MKRISKVFLLSCAVIISIVIARYETSTDRAIEKALGLSSLPKSLTDKHVWEFAFKDYAVRAYFRVGTEDFKHILAARTYSTNKWWSETLPIAPPQFKDYEIAQVFSNVTPFTVEEVYEWQQPTSKSICTIWTDNTHSFVFVKYCTD